MSIEFGGRLALFNEYLPRFKRIYLEHWLVDCKMHVNSILYQKLGFIINENCNLY